MNVIVLNTLGDVVKYIDIAHREGHPAFKRFWNEAGILGRLNYCIENKISEDLKNKMSEEVFECKNRYNSYENPHISFKQLIDDLEMLLPKFKQKEKG